MELFKMESEFLILDSLDPTKTIKKKIKHENVLDIVKDALNPNIVTIVMKNNIKYNTSLREDFLYGIFEKYIKINKEKKMLKDKKLEEMKDLIVNEWKKIKHKKEKLKGNLENRKQVLGR